MKYQKEALERKVKRGEVALDKLQQQSQAFAMEPEAPSPESSREAPPVPEQLPHVAYEEEDLQIETKEVELEKPRRPSIVS